MDELSTPFVLNRVSGPPLTFKLVMASGRIAFRNAFVQDRKEKLTLSLVMLGIPLEDALKKLNDFDARAHRLQESDALGWVRDDDGQREAVILSLRRDDPKAGDAEFDALDLAPDERKRVAAAVLNVSLVKDGDGPFADGAPAPNGTGPETPTGSGATAESPTHSPSPSTCSTPA